MFGIAVGSVVLMVALLPYLGFPAAILFPFGVGIALIGFLMDLGEIMEEYSDRRVQNLTTKEWEQRRKGRID